MLPNHVLALTKGENGQIVVNGVLHNEIRFIGSSVPVNLRPGTTANFLVLEPTKPGIVAVSVKDTAHFRPTSKWDAIPRIDFLLNVEADGKNGFVVNNNNHGKTMAGRLAGFFNHHRLEVMISDVLFMSEKPSSADHTPYQVVDGNVLCQYLAGDIGPEEVSAAAGELEAKESALERLPKLEAELSELRATHKEVCADLAGLMLHNKGYSIVVAEMLAKEAYLKSVISDMMTTLKAVHSKWYTLRITRQAIDAICETHKGYASFVPKKSEQ